MAAMTFARKACAIIAMTALASSCSRVAASSQLHVHDGDTFMIAGQWWRLWGVDAVELDQTCIGRTSEQPCGYRARDALIEVIGDKPIRCEQRGISHKRLVGRCWAGSVDLSSEMARRGWALDWPRYSHGLYSVDERSAREAKRGVWATQFTPPWEFRKRQR